MPSVEANGLSVHYTEQGEGDPLLLIMGITAPGSVWADHANVWSREYRCVMPDNRGVGFTDKPAGPYSTAEMADDMARLLDELDLDNVRVVGLSMGGCVAQQLALRHPRTVRSMILMCPWARCDRRTEGIFRHMMHAKARFRPEEFMHFMHVLIFARDTWEDDAALADMTLMRAEAAMTAYPQPVHGLDGQVEACIRHDVLHDLAHVHVPTMVLAGKEDAFIPFWMAEEVAGTIPGCELEHYDGAGHAFHFERLDEVNHRVLEWLRTH